MGAHRLHRRRASRAGGGGGAFNAEAAVETVRWYLPEAMLRHEGGARPEDLRILRVRGDSMEPQLREGDRLLVDPRPPHPGDRRDGGALGRNRPRGQARRDRLPTKNPPRLLSANPDYPAYTCLAGEAHVAGKVLWTLRKV